MDEERRRMDDAKWDRVFSKLEMIRTEQIEQKAEINHINQTLYKNNGETCIITSLKDLTKSVEELKSRRLAFVTTAQAIWTLIFGFLSIASTATAIILTLKQLGVHMLN
jgi:hypothetical protein